MGIEEYRVAYEKAASELEALLTQQERIERRIFSLRKTMNVLSTLIEEETGSSNLVDSFHAVTHRFVNSTLTRDIEKVVALSTNPLTTSEVRDEINKLGNDLAEQSNPLATVNAILNRLGESGRVEETVKDGRKAWKALSGPRWQKGIGGRWGKGERK